MDALFDAVIYNVNGSARANANGLATFYPIKSDGEELTAYVNTAAYSKNYVTFLESSRKNWTAPADFTGLDFSNPEAETPVSTVADDDFTVSASTWIDDDGVFQLKIDSDPSYITDVCFTLYQMDYEYNEYMFLGRDNDIFVGEDKTSYSDNFRGVWPALEGVFVNIDLLSATDSYYLYSIPISLNGEDMFLRATYNFDTERYEILGVVPGSGDSGYAGRNMRQLAKGDKIEVLMVGSNWETGDETRYSVGSFVVDDMPELEEQPLIDGDYLYQYEITDVLGNTYYSTEAIMECKDGNIFVYETQEDS